MSLSRLIRASLWVCIVVGILTLSPISGPVTPANAATIDPVPSDLVGANDLARSMMAEPYRLVSASFMSVPPLGTPHGVSDSLSFFPTDGDTFAILTSGNASFADAPNNSTGSGANIGGSLVPGRGNTAYDVTVLALRIGTLSSHNCLRLDFAFYSEEFPEYVGSAYNDAFIAEIDQTSWTTQNREISAPDNFVFDEQGAVISINSTGATSMNDLNGAGTTYDGGTVLLQGATPLSPNVEHTLYLSIFDQGDHVLDSAVFIDNIRLETVQNPALDCVPGAKPATRTPIIFLPGVGGTYLNNHNGEIWPNITELALSSSDDFLLPLRLDATGTGPLYPNNLDYSTVAAGDVMEKVAGQNVYGYTFETLEAAGYVRNVDLFPFPYDWRQNIETLAGQLLFRIDQIRAQTGAEHVDIVAHSMGGLITRAMLTDPNSVGKVRKVITLGTPVLGSLKIMALLEYQADCFLDKPYCMTNNATTQKLLTNMIPGYQILPSPSYDMAHMPPLNIDRDTNGDGQPEGLQGYTKWSAIISAHRNAALMAMNQPFHQTYDNLTPADASVQMFRVAGDSLDTTVQIREYNKCYPWPIGCSVKYELVKGDGDGTVPLHSADLYNPATGFDYRAGMPNAYAHDVDHGALPGDDKILDFVLSFLGMTPPPNVSPNNMVPFDTPAAASEPQERQEHDPTVPQMSILNTQASSLFGLDDTPQPFGGIELEAVGPVQGAVQDELGALLGLDPSLGTDVVVELIPGGNYEALADTRTYFLNKDGSYLADLTVTGSDPVFLRMRTYAEDAMTGQAVFNVSAPVGARLQIAFTTGQDLGSLQMQIDTDADGVFDKVALPDSFYVGPAAAETTPPTTTLSLHWVSPQNGEVTLTAQDQAEGTGVAHTYYWILNGSDPEATVYTGPFSIPLGAQVQFFSDDRVGNTELIQTLHSALLDIKPCSFPNSINLGSKGKTPAAILGTSTLDVTTVDIASITLAGAPVAKRNDGTWMASYEDVNRDGYQDLVFHVTTSQLQLDSSSTEAFLNAQTSDGLTIIGVDAVTIVH